MMHLFAYGTLMSDDIMAEVSGQRISAVAATYVVHDDFIGCLDGAEWDFAAFLRNGKESFCKSYKGYRALI